MSRKFTPRALGRNMDALLRKAAPAALQGAQAGMEMPMRVENGLAEAVGYPSIPGMPSGVGTSREPVNDAGGALVNLRYYLVSNLRQLLSQAYAEIGLVRTICDVPVEDAMRGGCEFKSKQLDEEQLEELQAAIERENDLHHAGMAERWNRLFGGAAVLALTDQDPETPLNIEALGPDSPLEFRACDMWELYGDVQHVEQMRDLVLDTEDDMDVDDCYNYYGVRVHKSRVIRMVGIDAPSFIRPRLRGWGLSVVEALVQSLNQYLKSTNLTYEVLDEFKLDIYKIKNLANTLMKPDGTQRIQQRIQLANFQKNYQNGIVMDAEDDYDHKQLSFAGLADAQSGIRMQVASDMRMPLTKLFGISASGFNSGEDDIEVYNGMVESQVRSKIKIAMLRIAELRCQQLFGFVPEDLTLTFKPLRVLSAVDEETVKTQKYNRLLQSLEAGAITLDEFRDACNRGKLFDVTLKNDDRTLMAIAQEQQEKAQAAADAAVPDKAPAAAPSGGDKETGRRAMNSSNLPAPSRPRPWWSVFR